MDWTGKDGDQYTDRNVIDHKGRIPFFEKIIPKDVDIVLEVGCNRGHNLDALRDISKEVMGIEINDRAYKIAKAKGLTVYCNDFKQKLSGKKQDLTLFSGVLIHQNPLDLIEFVKNYQAPYILIIEHKTDSIQTINSRWYKNAFWTMDFGKELTKRLPYSIIKQGWVNGKKPDHEDYAKPLEPGQAWHDLDYFWLMEVE
jgi:SAM-dependent methyltransferase